MIAMICETVTPCLGVSITSTWVVLGIAAGGRPAEAPGMDCASNAIGSIATRKGTMNFIGFPFVSVVVRARLLEYGRTLKEQKNYCSTNWLIKKFLASINRCSRFLGFEVTRARIRTPAMLENSNLHFSSFSSRVWPGMKGNRRSRYASSDASIRLRTDGGFRPSSGPRAERTQPAPGEFACFML